MTIQNFIPVIWSAKILENLQKEHVFLSAVNHDYEGEIRDVGDAVKINSTGRVTISNYTRDADIASPEALHGSQVMLVLDQAKYFNFAVDDIDVAQQKPQIMGSFTEQAAWELADVQDSYLATLLHDNTATATVLTGVTVGVGGSDINLYNILVNLGVVLSEQNVPKPNRYVFLPPWCRGLLAKDDRFVRYGTPPQEQILTKGPGFIMNAAGFDLYETNNMYQADGTHWTIQAGVQAATTFAQQILKTEAYRPPLRFSDALKGLSVYAGKVTRPFALARVDVAKGTLA